VAGEITALHHAAPTTVQRVARSTVILARFYMQLCGIAATRANVAVAKVKPANTLGFSALTLTKPVCSALGFVRSAQHCQSAEHLACHIYDILTSRHKNILALFGCRVNRPCAARWADSGLRVSYRDGQCLVEAAGRWYPERVIRVHVRE